MDRETVLAIAKQCGHWSGETIEMNDVGIERFANLIHDHLTWSDIHTCHPGCTRPPCVAMREAVLAEREAIALLCSQLADNSRELRFAKAIRSRK